MSAQQHPDQIELFPASGLQPIDAAITTYQNAERDSYGEVVESIYYLAHSLTGRYEDVNDEKMSELESHVSEIFGSLTALTFRRDATRVLATIKSEF